VRVVKDPALLLLDADDVRYALEGAPEPFAADPEAKKRGMSAFQPHALTISRGTLWRERRDWTEAVLQTPATTHSDAARFVKVVEEEVGALGPEIAYEDLHRAYQRLTRRIVLGESAADDDEVTRELGDLMAAGNGMPSERPDGYDAFAERIASYVSAAEPGSLAGAAAAAEPASADVRPDGQVPHWLFATQDTLSANAMRAAALLGSHPEVLADAVAELAKVRTKSLTPRGVAGLKVTRATLLEAMRLWPTTPLLSRETTADVTWHGVRVPAGTNVLISNVFLHRDRARLGDAADRCTPAGWIDGAFGDDWALNFFSHGPQGCPGANLALLLGTATLATILRKGNPALVKPALDPSKPLPHMLDVFALRVRV
jgi:cytochrome P450